MRKRIALIAAILTSGVIVSGCTDPSNAYEVLSSIASNNNEGSNWNRITVLVDNQENITKEEIASAIIDKYIENTFEGMMFSFDMNGYAETLEVEVDEYVEASDSYEKSFMIEFSKESVEPVKYSVEIE